MTKPSDSIRRGLEEALAFVDSTADPSGYRVHAARMPDVRAIRDRLAMTQEQFAEAFGFSLHTLRHWEQGRRAPEGPARAYLVVIDRDPAAVRRALLAA